MKRIKVNRKFVWNISKKSMLAFGLSMVFILSNCLQVSATTTDGQQKKTVTGKVISEVDNEPVIGATVSIDGTTTGTITNIDGEFTIDAESNDVLLISF